MHLSMCQKSHNIVIVTLCAGANPRPRDCKEAYKFGCRKDGLYTIDPGCGTPFNVFCDMENGGWTVFQRRRDGSENFYRGWADYVAGFGDLKGEHWLGLEKLVCLTARTPRTELRVDLGDYEGNYKYAQYSFFSVGNQATKYQLRIGGYNGTAGDSLVKTHDYMHFSTKDQDNDRHTASCASHWKGAWWYNKCHTSNLNGMFQSGQYGAQGVIWHSFSKSHYSLKFAQMKLRSRD